MLQPRWDAVDAAPRLPGLCRGALPGWEMSVVRHVLPCGVSWSLCGPKSPGFCSSHGVVSGS